MNMLISDYLVIWLILLVALMSWQSLYKTIDYMNVYNNLSKAQQSWLWIQVKYYTDNTNIFKLVSNYVNQDSKYDVKEYNSLSDLKSNWLSDLNKYDTRKHFIIIQQWLTNWHDVTTTFKNYDIDTILSTYDVNKVQIYRLKFENWFYILIRIY